MVKTKKKTQQAKELEKKLFHAKHIYFKKDGKKLYKIKTELQRYNAPAVGLPGWAFTKAKEPGLAGAWKAFKQAREHDAAQVQRMPRPIFIVGGHPTYSREEAKNWKTELQWLKHGASKKQAEFAMKTRNRYNEWHKHQYEKAMILRKRWIEGGKKGPEPPTFTKADHGWYKLQFYPPKWKSPEQFS